MQLVVDNTKLPRILVVDPTTMKIVADVADPPPDDIATAVGVTPPAVPLVDGRFTASQWDMIKEMVQSGPPPADPTNAVADAPGAAALGASFTTVLSPTRRRMA